MVFIGGVAIDRITRRMRRERSRARLMSRCILSAVNFDLFLETSRTTFPTPLAHSTVGLFFVYNSVHSSFGVEPSVPCESNLEIASTFEPLASANGMLDTVQRTIKVIGRGPRLKIVFRSHSSTLYTPLNPSPTTPPTITTTTTTTTITGRR